MNNEISMHVCREMLLFDSGYTFVLSLHATIVKEGGKIDS